MRPTYKPELSGGTHLAVDLVKDLKKSGHEVEIITPISSKFVDQIDESKDECVIHRVTSRFNKKDPLSRILRYIDVSLSMKKIASRISNVDLIMTHSMPPLIGFIGARIGKKKNIPVLYWEQDIVSESLKTTGIFGNKGIKQNILFTVAQKIEIFTERKSTHIVTISRQFQDMHINRGVPKSKVSVVYNWIDTKQVYPVHREENPLFDELSIPKNKFIVTYCGNLGVPQNVEILIDAAERLKDYPQILFVIIGGGSREKRIKQFVDEKALENLMLFSLQPLEKSHLVYSIGDIGTVIGRAGTSRNGFPSKTWSIMAAGQAMISCFDLDSELTSFVKNGKCGIAVEPDSPEKLADAILTLYFDKNKTKECGTNARKFVEENFSRMLATSKIIKIAESLIQK